MSENNELPPIDLSYLQEYTDGDEEVMDELIEVFKETASEGIDDFRKGIEGDDLTPWKAAAHKLKGASGYVGASHLKALCVQAEEMNTPTSGERSEFFKKIEKSYEDVCQLLEDRKA